MNKFSPEVLGAIKDHRLDCGLALMKCNRHAQAILEFEAVMQLEPSHAMARWHRCLALLSIGDYAKGMKEHDAAWELHDWHSRVLGDVEKLLALPLWQGNKCNLIVYHQEGFGDAIMCMRILPKLIERCGSVTIIVPFELVSLMNGYDGIDVVTAIPGDCSIFDARVTLFNSMWMLGCITQKTIPSSPYISAEFKLGSSDKKKMGICWSGNAQRNFTLNRFISYLNVENYELFSLQKTTIETHGVNPLLSVDFKATVKLMEILDVIVTVDTSAAHLAGAIGHPNSHVIIPYWRDWRWWNKDWWYPTLNIYPQEDPADWDIPFGRINEVLMGNSL